MASVHIYNITLNKVMRRKCIWKSLWTTRHVAYLFKDTDGPSLLSKYAPELTSSELKSCGSQAQFHFPGLSAGDLRPEIEHEMKSRVSFFRGTLVRLLDSFLRTSGARVNVFPQ